MQRVIATCSKFGVVRRILRATDATCCRPRLAQQTSQQFEDRKNEPTSLDEWCVVETAMQAEMVVTTIDVVAKRVEFVAVCAQIDPLLQTTAVFDGYLLSIAFIYFQRLGLWCCHYNKRSLYAALYLASGKRASVFCGSYNLFADFAWCW